MDRPDQQQNLKKISQQMRTDRKFLKSWKRNINNSKLSLKNMAVLFSCSMAEQVYARDSCAVGLEFESQTAKSYTALQAVRYRFNIYKSSSVALTL